MTKNSNFFDLNFKNFPVGILIVNDQKIIYKNDKAEELNLTNNITTYIPFNLPEVSTTTEISIPSSNQPIYANIIPYKINEESTHLIILKREQEQEEHLQNLEKKLIQLSEMIYRSNEFFKCIESEINLGILKISDSGIIEYQNEIIENMVHQFLIGKYIVDIIPDATQQKQMEYILKTRTNGNITFKMNINDNSYIWLKIKITHNDTQGFIITAKDVTYQEETIEKLLAIKTEVKKIVDEEFRKV